jgi:hypothetical protein
MFAHTRTRKLKIMRTKTLLLSGVVAALSSVSLMAQVYSLNAVGYINVTCPVGFSIIANQLNTGNNVITNLIQVDPGGSMDGDTIYKYVNTGTPSTSGYHAVLSADSLNPPYYWDGSDPTITTLNPGEAAFFYNANPTPLTLTFVGTVLQGSLTNNMIPGFNLISSQVPQAGTVFAALGIPLDAAGSDDGDTVYIMDAGKYDQVSSVDSLNPPSNLDGTQAPSVNVGQGFFYYRGNPTTQLWIRNFSVN